MEEKTMKSSESKKTSYHLVRGMDLNHHGTLFAGKASLLFVEAGFIVTSLALETNEIVCLRIHGMLFKHPVKSGETISLTAQIVNAGRTSVGVYVRICSESTKQFVVDGFLTFVSVDEITHQTVPHKLTLDIDTDEACELAEKYKAETSSR